MSQTIHPDLTLAYSRIVERYAHFFDRPEVRLRFFQNTLKKQIYSCERLNERLSRFKFIERTGLQQLLLDWWLYVLIIKEVNRFSRSESKGARRISILTKVPLGSQVLFHLYRLRYAFGVLCVFAMMLVAVNVPSFAARLFQTQDASATSQKRPTPSGAGTTADVALTKYLPDYKPVKVWLVEQKGNFERYSNGLRIQLDYETNNHRRGYNVFTRDGVKIEEALHHEPVGIVYHTSESEMIPFKSENSDSIESHSYGLLKYVQTNRSYNYVIDRFGQVYRIVRDDQAANHAGNSVWADSKAVYVGLNESFLGICFETRSEADQADDQLTEAQILAGRLLTQALRSRYEIDDANCVTHGLVSVNPSNMMIAYHHDWVKNFPFAAMGLSDKYQVPTVSISVYGFSYEETVVELAGGHIWPGGEAAEAEFRGRALRADVDVTEMRRRMRDLYREQLAEQTFARRSMSEEEAPALSTGPLRPFDNELKGDVE